MAQDRPRTTEIAARWAARGALVARTLLLMLALLPQPAAARPDPGARRGDPAASLHFANDIMAMRAGDARLYVLLGSGFLRPLTAGKPERLVHDWLDQHRAAIVIPVSRTLSTDTRTHEQNEIVYVWIEDADANLNVELVRAGCYLSATMYDMVDNEKGLNRLLESDPKLSDVLADIRKERAAAPQDRTDRLVSDQDYATHLARFADAERHARSHRLCIWSRAMREERQIEGVR